MDSSFRGDKEDLRKGVWSGMIGGDNEQAVHDGSVLEGFWLFESLGMNVCLAHSG